MPPKAGKPSSGKARPADESKEETLQAVIVADTFETKFGPFTLEKPRCLLPLANTPIIEYTLEYFASVGAQEVFIYPGAHFDQVEQYIINSKWHHTASPFKKVRLLKCVASSIGDVMRDLDQKDLISGDFLVVSGDLVCDFPIKYAFEEHKNRRIKDKNAIMTMLLREANVGQNQQRDPILPTFVIDPINDRCLHYEEAFAGLNRNAHIDPEILKLPEIDVRQDLVDCRIDICTPEVLSLWSDNFDNQTPRKDFLHGVLKDYELNGKTIHTYIVENQYAARADGLQSYASISNDLQKRLASSIAVDNNLFSESHYRASHRRPVQDSRVIIARPSEIDSQTIIGHGTSVGAGSRIRASVLGQHCQIGKATNIEASSIWDNVTVGSNVKMLRAIIGNEVFIADNCNIGEGALISYGVKIAAGTHVPPGSRITKSQQANGSNKDNSGPINGVEGEVHEYVDDDEDEDNFIPMMKSGLLYQLPEFADSLSTFASDVSRPPSPIDGSRSQSFATTMSDDDNTDRFQHDTVAILFQRMEEGRQVDDMLSELMGLRFSGGADESQVRKAVAIALMKYIHKQIEAGVRAAEASRKALTSYRSLIRRPQADQTVEEQALFLLDIQKDLIRRKEGSKTLLFVSKDLYDLEIFGEDSFLKWWQDERSSQDSDLVEVRQQTAQFIEWLESADSESDGEEADD